LADDPESEVPRSIRLPQKLWDKLDADAKRCKRSTVKQLEALLTKWYGVDDIEIRFDKPQGSEGSSGNSPDSHQSSPKTGTKKRTKSA
jgi:hypothetical protein